MAESPGSTNSTGPAAASSPAAETTASAAPDQTASIPGLAEKQEMVEKLFRHTNQFLAEHKHDPLLVVEALAAILVRYAALLGPVEQMPERLHVLERLIGQECAQIQEIARSAKWPGKA